MDAVARFLTDYVLRKGVIKEEQQEIYYYGFLTGTEMLLSIIVSFIIALVLHMLIETVCFFLIFIPLRGCCGGFHMKKYSTCFVFSIITLMLVLLITKSGIISICMAAVIFCVSVGLVLKMGVVDSVNKPLDQKAVKYFRKRQWILIGILAVLWILLAAIKKESFVVLETNTVLLVAITSIMGRISNRSCRCR